jgi:hypothetical protein
MQEMQDKSILFIFHCQSSSSHHIISAKDDVTTINFVFG